METAIGYVRVSTVEQASEGVSLEAQQRAVEAYCAMKGLQLLDVVVDAGVSAGKALATREGGARIVSALASRKASHVIAYKLDRLFRDAADCLEQTAQWDKKSVALHLVDMGGQAIDTSTAMGRFFLTVIAGAAEMERNLIRERTRAALAHKREKGERISGKAPFGYRFVDGMVVECEREQRAYQLIVEMRRDGWTQQRIANELAARGAVNREGNAITRRTVGKILNCGLDGTVEAQKQGVVNG